MYDNSVLQFPESSFSGCPSSHLATFNHLNLQLGSRRPLVSHSHLSQARALLSPKLQTFWPASLCCFQTHAKSLPQSPSNNQLFAGFHSNSSVETAVRDLLTFPAIRVFLGCIFFFTNALKGNGYVTKMIASVLFPWASEVSLPMVFH